MDRRPMLAACLACAVALAGCTPGAAGGNGAVRPPAAAASGPAGPGVSGLSGGAAVATGSAAPGGPVAPGAALPPASYAPGVASAAGLPPALRPELRKSVQLPPGTRLYQGPGDWYQRQDRPAPERLPFRVLWNGWIGLESGSGLGWLPAEERLAMADLDGDGAEYLVEPPRQWSMRAADGLAVTLRRPSPGVLLLEVAGAPEAAAVTAYPEGSALLLRFGSYRPHRARIDVGEDGLRSVSTGPEGMLLEFESLPVPTVHANAAGQVAMELRPRLDRIAPRMEGRSLALQLSGRGRLPTRAEAEAGGVRVQIPGAALGPEVEPGRQSLPAESGPLAQRVELAAGADGLELQVATRNPYRIRKSGQGLDLVIHSPGLAGKRIVVDPGHGAGDTGTATPWGQSEKEINLSLSLLLADQLRAAGADVLLLRTGDTEAQVPPEMKLAGGLPSGRQRDLTVRAAIANWWDADALLSIHHNGGGPAAQGTEVYWHTNLNADGSQRLARLAQSALLEALGTVDRGVIRRPFSMVRLPNAPAVLVEIGFLTNGEEARRVTAPEAQARAARALVEALRRFFAEV